MNTKPISMKKAKTALPSWRDELSLIRPALGIFALTVLLTIIIVGASAAILAGQDATLEQNRTLRDASNAKLTNVETEKSDIVQFQARFVQLQALGLIGDEKRLDWIEAIKQIQAERHLLAITYEIDPQQTIVMAAGVHVGDYQLHASKMHLHMALLHEMDLFHLLDTLHQYGVFTLQDCNLKRVDGPTEGIKTARANADCTLNWITLDVPAKAPLAPASLSGKGWP